MNVNTFHKLMQNSVQIRFLSFLVQRSKKLCSAISWKRSSSTTFDSVIMSLGSWSWFLITSGIIHIKLRIASTQSTHTLTKLNLLLLIFATGFYCFRFFGLNICNNAFHSNCNVHYGCKLESCYLSFYAFSSFSIQKLHFFSISSNARYISYML